MHYYAINSGGQELSHFGILGMKWGVRRYQNEDGSLTQAGKARYNVGGALDDYGSYRFEKKRLKEQNRKNRLIQMQNLKKSRYDSAHRRARDAVEFYQNKELAKREINREDRRAKLKNRAIAGSVAGAATFVSLLSEEPSTFFATAVASTLGAAAVSEWKNRHITEFNEITKQYIKDIKTDEDKVNVNANYEYKKKFS